MSKRILVIDDSPTIRKVVTSILERGGYHASAAADGQQGLDALSNGESFDLVLLDFVMPRMNGYQFCRAVRTHEQHKHVPIVLMSAKSDRIREQFVQQTGAVDAITKPFDAQALVAVIENAFNRLALGTARSFESFEGDEPPTSLRASSPDEMHRASRAAADVGAKLARALSPMLGELADKKAEGGENAVAAHLAGRLSPELLRELFHALQTSELGGHVILAG